MKYLSRLSRQVVYGFAGLVVSPADSVRVARRGRVPVSPHFLFKVQSWDCGFRLVRLTPGLSKIHELCLGCLFHL